MNRREYTEYIYIYIYKEDYITLDYNCSVRSISLMRKIISSSSSFAKWAHSLVFGVLPGGGEVKGVLAGGAGSVGR